MFSIALDSCARVRRRDRADRARRRFRPARLRTRSCRARGGMPRSGTVTVRGDVVFGPSRMISGAVRVASRPRPAPMGRRARRATPRVESVGVRRGLQHELTGAAIVNPDRRAIRAEQAVGAVTEDVEPRREVQRRREAAGELVEQRAHVALQLVWPAADGTARAR